MLHLCPVNINCHKYRISKYKGFKCSLSSSTKNIRLLMRSALNLMNVALYSTETLHKRAQRLLKYLFRSSDCLSHRVIFSSTGFPVLSVHSFRFYRKQLGEAYSE